MKALTLAQCQQVSGGDDWCDPTYGCDDMWFGDDMWFDDDMMYIPEFDWMEAPFCNNCYIGSINVNINYYESV